MKKIFKEHKALSILAIVIISLITISGVWYSVSNANTADAPKIPDVSFQQQANKAVSYATLDALTEKEIKGAPLTYPENQMTIKVVSSTEMLNYLKTQPDKIIAASISPSNHNIAIAKNGAAGEYMYIAKYLDVQAEEINSLISEGGINLNVVDSGSSSYNYNGPANNASSTTNSNASTPDSFSFWDVLNMLIIGFIIYMVLSFFISRKKAKKANELKKEKADLSTVPETRFSDVAGCEEAVEEMQELVEFLKFPERFEKVKAKPPKGALLVGPPGTGKTMLARAVAGEAGVPFYNVAGSDFVEMYVGVGAKRVRELFEKARKHPEGAIVFIDEIDAIGRARSTGATASNNSEQENTLNALLVELDGFNKSKVVILGATNRDDLLDKALIRPGRLEKKVHVPLPDRQGREKILQAHSKDRPLGKSVNLSLIARRTPGMSGAELAQVVNEACMTAARDNREIVTDKDFDESIAIVTMGKGRKSAVVSYEDRLLTAWHEAGHAICGLLQDDAVSPVAISILPRSFAGGVTHFPARDSGYMTRKQAYTQLVTAMGGMAAEQLHIGDGEFTTGPSSDLQQGSKLAFAMVTQYGMGESLFVKTEGILGASAIATDEAIAEAEALLRKALEDAKHMLKEHMHIVNVFVEALLERETLSNLEIEELMAGHKLAPLDVSPPAPRQENKTTMPKPKIQVIDFKTPEKKRGLLIPIVSKLLKPRKNKKGKATS